EPAAIVPRLQLLYALAWGLVAVPGSSVRAVHEPLGLVPRSTVLVQVHQCLTGLQVSGPTAHDAFLRALGGSSGPVDSAIPQIDHQVGPLLGGCEPALVGGRLVGGRIAAGVGLGR